MIQNQIPHSANKPTQFPQGPSINVRVWINQAAKEKACLKIAQDDAKLIFIAWSTVTAQLFQDAFRKQGIPNEVILAREVISSGLQGKNFVLLERHYDHNKEIAFLQSIKSGEALAQVSLSDPIMTAFDGERIKKVMDTMGHAGTHNAHTIQCGEIKCLKILFSKGKFIRRRWYEVLWVLGEK